MQHARDWGRRGMDSVMQLISPRHLPLLGIVLCAVAKQGLSFTCYVGSEYVIKPSQGRSSTAWVLPYQDPCWCTSIRFGGHQAVKPYNKLVPMQLEGLIISEDAEEIRSYLNCPARCSIQVKLGLEDGTIPDGNITASSSYAASDVSTPARGRLNKPDVDSLTVGAWAPAMSDTSQWIQVDLGKATYVFGVLMQGRDGDALQWVTKYKVQYETFPAQNYLAYVQDQAGKPQVFDGNTNNRDTTVKSLFDQPFVAAKVRIVPVEWHGYIALRFELLGCK